MGQGYTDHDRTMLTDRKKREIYPPLGPEFGTDILGIMQHDIRFVYVSPQSLVTGLAETGPFRQMSSCRVNTFQLLLQQFPSSHKNIARYKTTV